MKILLINPPITTAEEIKVEPHPPMGLAYLASTLENNHHVVKILDALVLGKPHWADSTYRIGLSDKKIKTAIQKYKPDIVGLSQMFTAYAKDSHRIAQIVKKINPRIITVLGGAHPSIDPKAVLRDKNVDYVVAGEGEIAFLNLVKAIESNKKNIPKVQHASQIKNLDTIPFPAWHLLPMAAYDRKNDPMIKHHPLFSVVSSRGCPGKCVFCAIHAVWGHRWRGRSAKNVVDEIEILYKKYGIREIHFQDDNLSLDSNRLELICREIIARGLKITWATPNGVAYWTLNPSLIALMKKAGCYRITFGIESADKKMRRWIGKSYPLSLAKKLTAYANRIGLWTIHTYILGFPYETEGQIEKTVSFAIDSGVDFALFYRLSPRWGTPVYTIFDKENWLDQKPDLEGTPQKTKYFTPSQLVTLRNQAYQKFLRYKTKDYLLHPVKIIQKIKSADDLVYTTKLFGYNIRLLVNIFLKPKNKITSRVVKGTF